MQLARGDVVQRTLLRRVDSARRRGLGVIRNNSPSFLAGIASLPKSNLKGISSGIFQSTTLKLTIADRQQ